MFKRFQPNLERVGANMDGRSLDALYITPLLTSNYVDSIVYLYFFCHWGETLAIFFADFIPFPANLKAS